MAGRYAVNVVIQVRVLALQPCARAAMGAAMLAVRVRFLPRIYTH
jgi:hypothetical protein